MWDYFLFFPEDWVDILKVAANIDKSRRMICRDVVRVPVGNLMAQIHQ